MTSINVAVEDFKNSNTAEYSTLLMDTEHVLVQQSIPWLEVINDYGEDTPFFVSARNANNELIGMIPAAMYENQHAKLCISLPLAGGYGGVVTNQSGETRRAVYQQVLEGLIKYASKTHCDLLTISSPPFSTDTCLYHQYLRPDFCRENFYQYIDLSRPVEDGMNSKQRNNLKRNLKIANEHSLVCKITDGKEEFEDWYTVHVKRMTDIHAEPLPKRLLNSILGHIVSKGLGFFTSVWCDSKLVAGGIFVGYKEILDVFILSADTQFLSMKPSVLLVYQSILEAQKRKFTKFNWQSSDSRESGVYAFKKEWGSLEANHYYLTKCIGDTSKIRSTSKEIVMSEFKGHYLMPYQQFEWFGKQTLGG
jgi:hypothetical protein